MLSVILSILLMISSYGQTYNADSIYAAKQEVQEAYNDLPEPVKQLYRDMECSVTIVEDIEEVDWAVGVFIFEPGYAPIIEIEYDAEDKTHVTYHEFGHLLDYGYNEKYESEETDGEFYQIYLDESDEFVSDYNEEYAASSPSEYFADAFAEYIKDPEQLKYHTPDTYYYVHNTINNIK